MTVQRRPLVAGGIAILAARGAAFGQIASKVWRIGFLSNAAAPDGGVPAQFREALHALGYVEGKNIIYEGRWAGAQIERHPAFVAELIALKVDLLVAQGAPAAAAARRATSTLPIIAVFAGDVVETGLVKSLARPAGNVTGINDPAAVLSGKRLDLLKEVVPMAKQVAVLWNAGDNAMTLRYRAIERAAQVLRVRIQALGVREPDDFSDALAAMTRERPDALMMVSDALTNLNRQTVIDFAAKNRIPAMYENSLSVVAGGLMSYGVGNDEAFSLAAEYVAKILKGAKPAGLPVEQLNRYFFFINLKTARALGLTIPQSALLRADEVIQ